MDGCLTIAGETGGGLLGKTSSADAPSKKSRSKSFESLGLIADNSREVAEEAADTARAEVEFSPPLVVVELRKIDFGATVCLEAAFTDELEARSAPAGPNAAGPAAAAAAAAAAAGPAAAAAAAAAFVRDDAVALLSLAFSCKTVSAAASRLKISNDSGLS